MVIDWLDHGCWVVNVLAEWWSMIDREWLLNGQAVSGFASLMVDDGGEVVVNDEPWFSSNIIILHDPSTMSIHHYPSWSTIISQNQPELTMISSQKSNGTINHQKPPLVAESLDCQGAASHSGCPRANRFAIPRPRQRVRHVVSWVKKQRRQGAMNGSGE